MPHECPKGRSRCTRACVCVCVCVCREYVSAGQEIPHFTGNLSAADGLFACCVCMCVCT